MKIELLTSVETFHSFHHQVERTKKRTITIGRQDLLNFLIDHSKLIRAVQDCTNTIIVDPKVPRKRVRLTTKPGRPRSFTRRPRKKRTRL